MKQYSQSLDPKSNSDLNKEFVRISKKDHVYYGQVNDKHQKHGIGTLVYDNGFMYQGMFKNDQMDGLGFSLDHKLNRYMGEHQEGQRNGAGIFRVHDGRVYEGSWRNNRLHGRCVEKIETGQSYLVFFNNGKRLDNISLENQVNKSVPGGKKIPVGLEGYNS